MIESLDEVLLRQNISFFSGKIFGLPYSSLKMLLYPRPEYRAFLIKKRSGSFRIINEPRSDLKDIQVKFLEFLVARSGPPKPCVHGFVQGRSIVSNAERHLAASPYFLLNVDLENFFPSISFYRVRGVFKKEPFNFSHEVATVLAQLCTYQNMLPQGAPTSPFISNLVCRSLDRDLMALASRHRATYTRYADDLTFSFSVREAKNLPENICKFESGLVLLGNEFEEIVQKKHNLKINPSKTRISTKNSRLEVTGISINKFTNVKREFIDKIRGGLHAWKKYGYAAAQRSWEQRNEDAKKKAHVGCPWKRQTRSNNLPQIKNILWGKLLYVRMVRGKDDSIYTRLADLYNQLVNIEKAADSSFRASTLPVSLIVRNSCDAEGATFVFESTGDYFPLGSEYSEMVGSQGTAFVYKKSTLLVTCDHVLDFTLTNGSKIDCQSGLIKNLTVEVKNPSTGASFPVTILHRDKGRDLAVLGINSPVPPHRYFAGLESPINRGESGLLVGFPNWSPGRLVDKFQTNVSNKFRTSALQRIEISTLIRQGNSGGPFVDDFYRVAGVAQQGATQNSGNNECLCVSELDKWIEGLPLP